MKTLKILSIGDVSSSLVEMLAEALSSSFSSDIKICDTRLEIEDAFEPHRNQYISTKILAKLKDHVKNDDEKILGIVEYDLCIPILTFVFGEAIMNGPAAVISLSRLHQEVYGLKKDDALLFQRSLKEALHELGHTFGLTHCHQWDCLMHASNTVEDIDMKGNTFCTSCLAGISKE